MLLLRPAVGVLEMSLGLTNTRSHCGFFTDHECPTQQDRSVCWQPLDKYRLNELTKYLLSIISSRWKIWWHSGVDDGVGVGIRGPLQMPSSWVSVKPSLDNRKHWLGKSSTLTPCEHVLPTRPSPLNSVQQAGIPAPPFLTLLVIPCNEPI